MSQPTERPAPEFETMAIVGVGLIGGSIAAAARRRSLARTLIGVGRNPARLAEARRLGFVDETTGNVGDAAARADLVVFCTPVDRIVGGVREAAARCRPGSLITDAGSVKGTICPALDSAMPAGVDLVGSHPLAGSEKQGFEHADPRLFENRLCVVTPTERTRRSALDRVQRFWTLLGMSVVEMTPDEHDRALSETSHLPHVVAAALAGMLQSKNARFAASGFRDTTRIAAGDPELWTAILLANARPVLDSLDRYASSLSALRQALAEGDEGRLRELLSTARGNRTSLPRQPGAQP